MTDITLATQAQAKPPIVVLREYFLARREELKAALPSDISPEQFIRAVVTGAQLNPEILTCSRQSIWLSAMRACRDGLLPDGIEGAFVPYKGQCSWIPMYQGLLRRFRRSGQYKWITAGIVYKGEEFKHHIDEEGEHFKHVPGGTFGGEIEKIYAIALTKDQSLFVAVLPIAEANKIRAMSKATREDSPWRQWPEEMLKKTALRRLSKMLPSSRDLAGIMDEEELAARMAEFGEPEPEQAPAEATSAAPVPAAASASPAGPSGTQGHENKDGAGPDEREAAWQRGKDARAAGHLRKAVPGEYREAAGTHLAAAWLRGFDGQPL